eukprot:gnl/Hemi2/25128_TR8457_c0_g2_i1.p3 gnl/Hemi2/25128_TR8457_c0_g2~~gnl/Hemi2/25128_TR8457_c0_g2_i1.p3  ORF type:complete len:118 (+),score=24.49 gnl/Hemi2/25128_TR8457_c0_g2_i1:632-985(+)
MVMIAIYGLCGIFYRLLWILGPEGNKIVPSSPYAITMLCIDIIFKLGIATTFVICNRTASSLDARDLGVPILYKILSGKFGVRDAAASIFSRDTAASKAPPPGKSLKFQAADANSMI